jgi:ATP-dependent RNA helicase DDX54/DBP10
MLSGQSVTGLAGLDPHMHVDVNLKKQKGGGFQTMGLTKEELKSVLNMGFSVPTPIQRKAIPVLMQGSDIVAMARTGSGKTAAYAVPMVHKLKEHSTTVGVRGLVLSPTRELSLQIMRELQKLSRHTNLRYCALVGGNSLEDQFARLAENPDVLIVTPGRLLHILEETKMQLTAVTSCVLDEADRLFEQGLQPQIAAILRRLNEDCQRALFSATMPSILAEFTEANLHNPVVVRLDAESKLSDTLKQSAFFVRSAEKPAALIFMLRNVLGVDAKTSQALVFVESKYHVDFFVTLLNHIEISTVGVHGAMDQEARKDAVENFGRRRVSCMIVTDVAARGIDLPLLDNVINYSFPAVPKVFIHRVGRVARAGRTGAAYSILTYDEMPYYVDLMSFINRPLQTSPADGAPVDLLYTPDDGCYGRMPDPKVQQNVDYIGQLVDTNGELEALFKVMERAHGKYSRTKKKASGAGIREAREDTDLRFENMPLHPIFAGKQSAAAKEQAAAVYSLRSFKSKDTILSMTHGEKVFEVKPKTTLQSLRREAEDQNASAVTGALKSLSGAPVRNNPSGRREALPNSGSAVASAPASSSGRPLTLAERLLARGREKRERDEVTKGHAALNDDDQDDTVQPLAVAARSNTRGALRADDTDAIRYQDREYFMPTAKDETMNDQHYSVKDVAIDFVADTTEDLKKQRAVFMWNKKKNKYVKTNINEAKAMLIGIKNEAGKAIDFKTKLDSYNKWTQRSNLRIQDVGEPEDAGAINRARALKNEVAVELGGDDEVDISDPNQGKKLRIGRKMRKMPKDGLTRSFDDLHQAKEKRKKDAAKLDARRAKKGKKRS